MCCLEIIVATSSLENCFFKTTARKTLLCALCFVEQNDKDSSKTCCDAFIPIKHARNGDMKRRKLRG